MVIVILLIVLSISRILFWKLNIQKKEELGFILRPGTFCAKAFLQLVFYIDWVLMSPKFQVYKGASGKTRFRLRADNNKIVAVGEAYKTHAGCINGIRSVQKNCGALIEDSTIEGGPKLPNPKYQIYKDASGEFRFRLKAANGEIIAQGQRCESKEGCLNGIKVMKNSANATIEDPFSRNRSASESQFATKIEGPPVSQQAELKPEFSSLKEEREDLTPTAPILSLKKDVAEDHGPVGTSLELYNAPENIAKGDNVTFRGSLLRIETKQGICGAKIRILARGNLLLGDDCLGFGTTTEDGSFGINWKARRLGWRKNTGVICATFAGNEKAKPSNSKIQSIAIK